MIELKKSDFSSVLPLLSSSKQEVLPFSIAQGINPGRIFIDQMEKPNIVHYLFCNTKSAKRKYHSKVTAKCDKALGFKC